MREATEVVGSDHIPTVSISSTKICRDCKHLVGVRRNTEQAKTWRCHAKQNISGMDMVSGLQTLRFKDCYDARSTAAGCGPEGAWFELYQPPEDAHATNLLAELG